MITSKYIIILFTLCFYISSCKGRIIEVEQTISKSSKLLDFVPDGYRLFDTIYGDLNNDNVEDCVLIIKGTNKAKIVKESNYKDKQLNLNRRGIILLFKKENQYQLALENYDCFASDENNDGDYNAPKLGVAIDKGNLLVNYANRRYGFWTYTFKRQNTDFELIAYDESDNNGSTAYIVTNINFLSKKKIKEVTLKGDADEYENDTTYQDSNRTIKIDAPIKLSKIKDFEGLKETIYNIKTN